VFQTNTGTVDNPAVESQITAMLGRVSHLPDVSSVTSPYTPAGTKPSGAGQISAGKTVAFATVNFSVDANSVPAAEATQFVNTARAPNSSGSGSASTTPCSSSPAPATGCAAGFPFRTRSPPRAAPPAGPCCSRA